MRIKRRLSRSVLLAPVVLVVLTQVGCSCNRDPSAIPAESVKDAVQSNASLTDPPTATEKPAATAQATDSSTGTAARESQSALKFAPPSTSVSNDSNANAPQPSGDQPSKNLAGRSPSDARRQAAKLLERAEKSAADGQYGDAFRQGLAAWQEVSPHAKQDAGSRELADALRGRLEHWGEQANRKADMTDSSKTIKVD